MHHRLNCGAAVFLGASGGVLSVAITDALLGYSTGAISCLVVSAYYVLVGIVLL